MARKTSVDLLRFPYQVKLKSQVGNPVASSTNQTICTLYELACSRHSDSGVRHEVKEQDEQKIRRERGRGSPTPISLSTKNNQESMC